MTKTEAKTHEWNIIFVEKTHRDPERRHHRITTQTLQEARTLALSMVSCRFEYESTTRCDLHTFFPCGLEGE